MPGKKGRAALDRPLVVQQSFPEPRPTTNPYIVMLGDALRAAPGLEVLTFSWKRVLLARYDVFHMHWPEYHMQASTPIKTLARQTLFALLLARLALRRVPIVRTQHNLHRPDGMSRRQRLLLRWFDRQTALRIALNDDTAAEIGAQTVVVPHGHYRDWFASYPRRERQAGAIGYFGLIRRYKNVEALIRAFSAIPGDLHLRVAGKPSTSELATSLSDLAAEDDRVALTLDFLTDAELVEVATGTALVVLPYTHMHNSGSVLASLSLDTPVLVPANRTNDALAAEVGPGWVLQFEGELSSSHLREALEQVRALDGSARPDLSRRSWDRTGAQHLDAYRLALGLDAAVAGPVPQRSPVGADA